MKRVNSDKAEGSKRPLSVSALEGKLVQRATVEGLSAIYEQDFIGFSYGFRPGSGAPTVDPFSHGLPGLPPFAATAKTPQGLLEKQRAEARN